MGGYNICGLSCKIKFVKDNLPIHDSVSITYDSFYVDSQDAGDDVSVFIDGVHSITYLKNTRFNILFFFCLFEFFFY